MAYETVADGIYLLRQKSREKGVDHYGILISGRWFGRMYISALDPVVVHQMPPRIKMDRLAHSGAWTVLERVLDEQGASRRLSAALAAPNYDLFGNNCEHFARFVATGKRESWQLQGAVVAGGLVALVVVAWRSS